MDVVPEFVLIAESLFDEPQDRVRRATLRLSSEHSSTTKEQRRDQQNGKRKNSEGT